MNKLRIQKGITLVELLVYLALFAIVIVFVIQFTLQAGESNRRSLSENFLEYYSIYLNEHINQSVDTVDTIDSINSTFETDDGTLLLDVFSGGTIEYKLVNDKLYVNRGSGDVPLTPSHVDVDQFYIEQILDSDSNLIGFKLTVHMISNIDSNIDLSIETNYLLP